MHSLLRSMQLPLSSSCSAPRQLMRQARPEWLDACAGIKPQGLAVCMPCQARTQPRARQDSSRRPLTTAQLAL